MSMKILYLHWVEGTPQLFQFPGDSCIPFGYPLLQVGSLGHFKSYSVMGGMITIVWNTS